MPLRRILILAVTALAASAAPAHADITISNVSAMPADTKAGANSNFTLSFDLAGSESVKDLDVALPPGLIGNPTKPAKCPQDQFDSGSCAADTQVGEQTVQATLLLVPVPGGIQGKVYNLVPDAGEPALLGIDLDTPGQPTRLKSHVKVRPEDSGLTSTLRDIPDMANGVPIHIDSISLTLYGETPSKAKFMNNPTSCSKATTKLHAVGHSDGTADGQGDFTPTACDALPYSPQLSATVGAEGATRAHVSTPITTVVSQGAGQANTKATSVTLMPPLTPSVEALSNVCPLTAFNSDSCPANSIVGQAEAITPLLPTPLSGPVRIVEQSSGLPIVVVYLNGLISQRLVGHIELAPDGTKTTFEGIPDVPLTRFKLDFAAGSSGLVSTSEDLCTKAPGIKAEFSSHSGKTVTVTTTANVNGCATGGGGGGGGGGTTKSARPIASVALRKLRSRSPVLRFKASRRSTSARKLRSVAITLPGPLSFDRGYLSPGVKAAKGLKVKRLGKHRLRLRTKSSKGAASIAATVSKRALKVGAKLKRRVRRHPKVKVVLRVIDVSGKAFTLRKSVTVR